jgi:hypothetical protein
LTGSRKQAQESDDPPKVWKWVETFFPPPGDVLAEEGVGMSSINNRERESTRNDHWRQAMTEETRVKNIGLRGVTVADSAISFIDGEKGVLIYRGYRIEDLADHSTFLETAYLLLYRNPSHQRTVD